MVNVLNYGLSWHAIQNGNLLDLAQDNSAFFKIELGNIARDKNDVVCNIRGQGMFIGFDM